MCAWSYTHTGTWGLSSSAFIGSGSCMRDVFQKPSYLLRHCGGPEQVVSGGTPVTSSVLLPSPSSDYIGNRCIHSWVGCSSVQILTNNTSAIWYVNKWEGVGSHLICQELLRFWAWVHQHGAWLVTRHLAGSLNTTADSFSQCHLAENEWCLHPEVVQAIFAQRDIPQVVFFTTCENAQCPQFCALQ